MIAASLRNGFTGLFRFSGRDRRSTFLVYAAVVITTVWTLGTLALFGVMRPLFRQARALAQTHPDQVRVIHGVGAMRVEASGDASMRSFSMMPIAITVAVVAAIGVGLLAAAVVRRLHDSGRSGIWALSTLLLLATGLAIFAMIVSRSPGALFAFGLLVNLLYLASLALLAVLLLLPGMPGPNRFGAPPP